MKKIISLLLALLMCVSVFAACDEDTDADAKTGLESAYSYVKTVYKDVATTTGADFQRIGTVPVGDKKYTVTWTADVSEDIVKIVVGDDGMVTIDVNEMVTEETKYVLTATLTEGEETKTLTWNHTIPAYVDASKLTPAEIVDLAYNVEEGVTTEDSYTLTGVISAIDTPWSADYQNITVIIKVEGKEDKPIMCYRLKNGEGVEGADTLAIGDTITVTGVFKNYNGTIEFDAGCTLDAVTKGSGAPEAPSDPAEIVDAGYALADGDSLPYEATLTGKIITIDTPYSADYGNITVTIEIEGKEDKPIMCYRLKGGEELAVGDTISVTGYIKNYSGTIEFNSGCTYTK